MTVVTRPDTRRPRVLGGRSTACGRCSCSLLALGGVTVTPGPRTRRRGGPGLACNAAPARCSEHAGGWRGTGG
jgi:hypothetical protein